MRLCLVKTASSIRPTAYASLGYVVLWPRSGYAPFGVGATRGKFALVHTPCVSSLALSTCVVYSPNGLRFARLCRPSASIRVRTFWRRRYAAGNSLDLVAQTSMRLSRLRQGAFSGLPRRGNIFGYVRKPLLRRRVFRSSLAKTRRFAPFSAKLMPNMS